MRSVRHLPWLAVVGLAVVSFLGAGACSSDDEGDAPGGSGGSTGGMAGEGGTGGMAGTGGTAGTGGMAGTGGTGGSAGTGGAPSSCAVADPGAVSEVHTCASLGSPPASGTCTVTPGTGATVYRGVVLAPDDLYEGGEVVVDAQGIIQCVACDCSATAGYTSATKVVCPEGVISPGLINAHDHITYGNNPPFGKGDPAALKNVRYQHRHEWRRGLNGLPEISVNSGASAAVQTGVELRFMMSGATSTRTTRTRICRSTRSSTRRFRWTTRMGPCAKAGAPTARWTPPRMRRGLASMFPTLPRASTRRRATSLCA